MNMNNLMAQAKKLQKEMAKKQSEIESKEFIGTSELVDVVLYGTKKIKKVTIKDKKNFDEDDLEILEDMIKIAVNEGLSKIDKEFEDKMGMYGNQLGGLF